MILKKRKFDDELAYLLQVSLRLNFMMQIMRILMCELKALMVNGASTI
ncbi:hypothetical protein [Macrococcoides caseolyticum]|nr:hypothetical protein [Macrococcus caseolyticus]MCE4957448.1 hypothetical protein [Macrococcus caseolyticus]